MSNEIITTDLYWDCECKDDYIHPSEQATCTKCGASRDDQPDSRLDEVMAQLFPHANKAILNSEATNE